MNLEGVEAALALAPIAFAGGFIQGLTGFGSALVTIPLATFFVPLPFALAVFAIVDFANGLRLGLENPRNAVLGDIARMVPLMIVGIVTGTTLLVNLPRNASLVALGIFVLGNALRGGRAALRDLSLAPPLEQGTVPRDHDPHHHLQHRAAPHRIRGDGPSHAGRRVDHRGGRDPGGTSCGLPRVAGFPHDLARDGVARGGDPAARERRLAYRARARLISFRQGCRDRAVARSRRSGP